MSFTRSLSSALYRSIDSAKNTLATAIRMDVTPRTSHQYGRLPLFALTHDSDIKAMAVGCDADLGGKSKMKLERDHIEGMGRFYGVLSNEVPRQAQLQRSGYAGFRNKNRPTLFGQQTWDTTMHPFLRLRVRNRLAGPPHATESSSPSPSFRSALSSSTLGNSGATTFARATNALGFNLPNRPGPKFFVNIQTDGPVTSDVYQHRLLFDESKGDSWHNVLIPLTDFVLMNTGTVSTSQTQMMREKIRTIGISAVLELPSLAELEAAGTGSKSTALPNALKQGTDALAERAEPTTETARGSRRAVTFNFDLGIERIEAISEEALSEDVEPPTQDVRI